MLILLFMLILCIYIYLVSCQHKSVGDSCDVIVYGWYTDNSVDCIARRPRRLFGTRRLIEVLRYVLSIGIHGSLLSVYQPISVQSSLF